jgi:hypothetical protein
MKLRVIFVLALTLQSAVAQQRVRWNPIDPFCGQIVSTQPGTFSIKSAKVRFYRANTKSEVCCSSATLLGDLRMDANGNFDLRKLGPGQYWIDLIWSKTEVSVALWVLGKDDSACREGHRNIIDVNPSTKSGAVRY